MAITNNLKTKLDLPVWEWMRFAPTATSATSAMCYGDDFSDRYMYYLTGTTFYRYDLISDSWQQLANAPSNVTFTALKYTSFGGYRGNVLSATSNGLTIPGLRGCVLKDYKIRILSGTGLGQERTISACNDSIIKEHGVITAVGAGVSISDSTKKWSINQWIGCQVRLVLGTGQSQIRKVLYNDTTTLYFADPNYQMLEPFNNTFFATAPVITAGSQAHYYIETTTISIDSAWTTIPDSTSSFVVLSGGVWLLTASASAPWSSFYFYDVLTDTWFTKTAIGGHLIAALGTDVALDRTGESGGVFVGNTTATSGAARSITCSTATYIVDQYANYQVKIVSGTGIGQKRRIVGNTATALYVDKNWDITPDTTSVYNILGNTDNIYAIGNANGTMYKYAVESDMWSLGDVVDYGQTPQISIKFSGQEAFAMSTGVRGTGGILTINTTPVAAGSGYVVGEVITLATGTGGKVRVTSTTTSGAVAGLELFAAGTGFTASTTYAQSSTTGSGTGCTCEVLTVGVVGRITTVQNHNLCKGDSITIAGCSESAWNTTYSLLSSDTLTTFDIAITATSNAVATSTQSTTVIVDATKNWTIGEHVGKIVYLSVAGTSPTVQSRRITANTATTLTVATITAAANGTSRYVIQEPFAYGRDEQYKVSTKNELGWATGGSTTTLIDSSKSWLTNQWAGYKFRILCGTGVGSEITITSNTATTLTYSTQTFTPDTTTKYLVMDTFGLATAVTNTTNAVVTDSTKNWTVNQWAGQRLRIIAGTGIGQEISITSNTATALTCNGVFTTAPDTTSVYTILGIPVRGAGTSVNWCFGSSDTVKKGKYLFSSRGGGSNIIDRLDLTTGVWDYTIFISPQSEVMSTGTMYTYDGQDYLYFTNGTTTGNRVFRVNLNNFKVEPCGGTPYAHGTAIIGNRMEIITTDDGLDFLYIMRHTGQEMWRCLIFW